MAGLLRLLLAAVALAAAAAWLADHPGRLVLNWQGYRIESSFLMLFALIVLLYLLVRLPVWAYGRWRGAGGRLARLRRGMQAFSRGMTALAAGDAPEARQQAARAERLLGGGTISLLMQAQAAQLSGDETAAGDYFRQMLRHTETEFIGLRGLLSQAMRQGDLAYAGRLVDRGLRLRPRSPWLLHSKFQIECATGAWGQARETLALAARTKLLSKAEQGRRRGVLALAEAQNAQTAGLAQEAITLAQEALKHAPDLVPAAVLAAQLLQQSGKTPKAERVLEKAWAVSPHPEIAAAYSSLVTGESPSHRAVRLRRLVGANPGHPESRLLAAEAALAAGETARARELLQPPAGDATNRRTCMLMALVVQAQGAGAMEVQQWLSRAALAPADPAWTCQACSRRSVAWQVLCPACGEFDTLQWRDPDAPAESAPAAGLLAQAAPV